MSATITTQDVIDLQHRLELAEQSILELEKNNHQMNKELVVVKDLIKILNQRIQNPESSTNNNMASHEPPPPHY